MRLRRLRRLGILNSTVDGLEERATLVHTKDGSDEERKHKQQRIDDDDENNQSINSISEKTENNNEDDFAKNNETRKLFFVLFLNLNKKCINEESTWVVECLDK